MILIAACDWGPGIADSAKVEGAAAPRKEPEPALRVKVDALRNRVWVLRPEYLDVYDRRTHHLIRRIALPRWSIAEFVCEPDLAIDRVGSAYISHNLEPKLWQVDPNSFELQEYAIGLAGREMLDIGFSQLTFAPDGALYGVASTGGSVWRIDLATRTAQQTRIDRPAADRCAFK